MAIPHHRDLREMPHCYLAGSTGDAKSPFPESNAIITSLAVEQAPFLAGSTAPFVVDDRIPKVVEAPAHLHMTLPHRVECPVVTDPRK